MRSRHMLLLLSTCVIAAPVPCTGGDFSSPPATDAKNALPAGAIRRLGEPIGGRDKRIRRNDRGGVQCLSCSADGRTLYSASSDGVIRLWDVATGKGWRVLKDLQADFRSLAVSADGKTIAAMDAEDRALFWSIAEDEMRDVPGSGRQESYKHRYSPKPLLAFSADGRTVVAGRIDGVLRFWQAGPANTLRSLPTDEDRGVPAALAPTGGLVASFASPSGLGSDIGLIRLRRLDSGKEVGCIQVTGDYSLFWAAGFSADGKILAVSRSLSGLPFGMTGSHSGPREHRLLFWEVASGKLFLKIDLRNAAQALAFSPDGKLLATANVPHWMDKDCPIRIWDVTTGKLHEQLPGHDGLVNALLFSPDGRRLFSGSSDGTILVWDTRWPHPRPRRTRSDLTAEQLRSAWDDLAGVDAARAFRSLSDLAAVPRRSLPFLREHLPTPPPLDQRLIARLIADLDSGDFAVREKARMELEKLDELAEHALRKTLQSRPSLEMQRRIENLLERLHQFPATAEQLRISRAMLALEWMNTAESRRLIEMLAKGTPGARLTREAKAIRQRLLRLSPGKP